MSIELGRMYKRIAESEYDEEGAASPDDQISFISAYNLFLMSFLTI